MFNGMFSGLNTKTIKKTNPNQNDMSSINTKVMRYANMVENSQRYIITTYRAPAISGNVYAQDNPIFNGMAYVQGNLYVVPNNDIDRYYQGPVTGYFTATRDIRTISGDVYTNDIYINGNLIFTNTSYGFKSNIYSPSLVSVSQTTDAFYSYYTPKFQMLAFGQQNTNQILVSSSTVNNLLPPHASGPNVITNPYIAGVNSFDGYCTDAYWNGLMWMTTGCGFAGAIAVSADGNSWTMAETFNIFEKGNTIQIPYGGAYSVEWNGTIWVAGGYGSVNTLAYSNSSGLGWVAADTNPFLGAGYCSCVKWNGSIWLATCAGISPSVSSQPTSLAYSYNGVSWYAIDGDNSYPASNTIFPYGCNFVAWNGNYWLAGGGYGYTAISYDGLTWTLYSAPSNFTNLRGAGWSGVQNKWIMVGDGSPQNMAYSYDGQTWIDISSAVQLTSAYSARWFQAENRWYATGVPNTPQNVLNTSIIWSLDGVTWHNISTANRLSPCYGLATTNLHTGFMYNQGNATFQGEQVTVQNSLYVNGDTPTIGPYTGTVVVEGGISNTGNSYIGDSLYIAGTADATSLNADGALMVEGGANISGNLFLGRGLYMTGQANFQQSLTVPTIYITSSTGVALDVSAGALIHGALTTEDSLYIAGLSFLTQDVSTNGNLFVLGNTTIGQNVSIGGNMVLSFGLDLSGNLLVGSNIGTLGNLKVRGAFDASGNGAIEGSIRIGGDAAIGGNIVIGGSFVTVNPYVISNTTDSIATDVGALTVAGGIGVAKSMVIGNTVQVLGGIESTSTGTGTLIIEGGIGVRDSMYVGGSVNVKSGFNLLSTGEATSTGTGALSLLGGLGIAKSIYVGGDATVLGTTTLYGPLYNHNDENIWGNLVVNGGSGIKVQGGGGASLTGSVNIVDGLGSLYVGGVPINSVISGTIFATTDAVFSANAFVNGTLDSTSTSTGALLVAGGVGIAKSVFVGGRVSIQNTTNSTSTATGALMVAGGVGIARDTNIGGNLTVNNYITQNLPNNNIYLSSSATPFAFASTGCTKNIILGYGAGLGLASGGSNNTFIGSNANFDSNGPYYNSTALGYNSTITASNQIVLGTIAESISIPGKIAGVDSTSTGNGALKVAGGVGISGNINIGNNTIIYGTVDAIATGTGTLIVMGGGASITKSLVVGTTATIQSTNPDTALLVQYGGATVSRNMNINGNTIISGLTTLTNTTESNSVNYGALVVYGGVGIGGAANIQNAVTINSYDDATSLGHGALIVSYGGASINSSLYVGQNATIQQNATVQKDVTILGDVHIGNGDLGGGSLYLSTGTYEHFFVDIYASAVFDVKKLNIGSGADLVISGNLYEPNNAYIGNLFLGPNQIQFDGTNYNSDAYFNERLFVVSNYDAYYPNANNGSLYVKTGAAIGNNLYVGHEVNSAIMKSNSLGLQYNFDNGTNQIMAFVGDGSFNLYLNGAYAGTATPGNIPVPQDNGYEPAVSRFTAEVSPGSTLVSGGGIAYNGYMWVGVFNGYQGSAITTRIFYSYDSYTWQTTNLAANEFTPNVGYTRVHWNGVGWDGNMWVTCGYPADVEKYNNIMFSYDGFDWSYPGGIDGQTVQNAVSGFCGHDVASNGRMWVSVGRIGNPITSGLIYSYNGTVWKQGTFADVSGVAGDSLDAVASANGRIWVTCGSNYIYYSYDGVTWHVALTNTSYNFTSVAWNGQKWLCLGTIKLGTTPILYSSIDGISWSNVTPTFPGAIPTLYTYYKVIWSPNLKSWYITCSNSLLGSTDAVNWTAISQNPPTGTFFPALNIVTNDVGNMNISGTLYTHDLTVANKVTIADTTNATSTSTGALVVSGGAGIGANLYVGGSTTVKTLTSGTVYSDANGVLSNTPSDVRYKDHIEDLSYGLDAVSAMRPVSYDWLDQDRFGDQREIGFIAQEMATVVPEVVRETPDKMLSLDYSKLVPVLVRAIQDLEKRVRELEAAYGGGTNNKST
jgi:carbonic anhydrase/acetyltransferase-like protein (isoleucine patch superfamily)